MYWDRAWALVSGCSPVGPECAHCWAAAEAHMRERNPNAKVAARNAGLTRGQRFNGTVRFNADLLDRPLRTRKPQTWAIWTDLFHDSLSDAEIDQAFGLMLACEVFENVAPSKFLTLTKRAARMARYFEAKPAALLDRWSLAADRHVSCHDADVLFSEVVDSHCRAKWGPDGIAQTPTAPWSHPGNLFPLRRVGLGVTAGTQRSANTRLPALCKTPTFLRYVSLEPLLEPVDFSIWLYRGVDESVPGDLDHDAVRWVVVGAETGLGRRPCNPAWIRSAIEQCRTAHVPIWVKAVDLGKRVSHDPSEWPEDLRVRERPWPV